MIEPQLDTKSWDDVREAIEAQWTHEPCAVFGVPRGGVPIALLLEQMKGCTVVAHPHLADMIVDDIYDSGRTFREWEQRTGRPVWTAFWRQKNEPWLVMPWEIYEERTGAEDAATRLLQALGAPLSDEGMAETPDRLVRSLRELTAGYLDKPTEILSKRFPVTYDEMIVVRQIEFWSLCEHHILPFHGRATIGYIPGEGGVVGLSKLARVVHVFARRFQIQERLTSDIASAIEAELQPKGVGVVVSATHLCMAMRGVKTPADMVTSDLRGLMREASARAEFLSLAGS